MYGFSRVLLLLLSFSFVACDESVDGNLTRQTNSSLQLYEGQQGHLIELTEGKMKVEIAEHKSILDRIMSIGEPIRLTVIQGYNKFFLDIDLSKVDKNGTFQISEVDLGQPVRIQGRFLSSEMDSNQSVIEVNIYKGFSNNKDPIWQFRTKPVESTILKQLRPTTEIPDQAVL
jgi:hypothetical protein